MSIFNYKRSVDSHTMRDGVVSFQLVVVVVLSLVFLQLPTAEAQQPPPPDNQLYARFSPSMAIIIVVLIAALFFMGFFSIYIRHCNDSSGTGNSIRQTLSMRRRTAAASRGLDASVLETFPTFTYAEVKDHKIGKGALECAVCLNEFEDDETLRLIPKCDHVFHPECIDAWLESHVTCPVCRANLVPESGLDQQQEPPTVETMAAENETTEQGDGNNPPRNDDVSIQIESDETQQQHRDEEQQEGEDARPEVMNRSGSLNRPPRSWSIKRPKMFSFGKFRSHSTGHSLVVPGENLDRFTLRLPDQVRKEMMTRALLNRTGSCAGRSLREGGTRRSQRTGGADGSSRGTRSYRRVDPLDRTARSERWTFSMASFSRALSIKSPKVTDNGEGSTSKSTKSAVRMPSFKCLEPKSADETGLVRSDSIRPAV